MKMPWILDLRLAQGNDYYTLVSGISVCGFTDWSVLDECCARGKVAEAMFTLFNYRPMILRWKPKPYLVREEFSDIAMSSHSSPDTGWGTKSDIYGKYFEISYLVVIYLIYYSAAHHEVNS